MKTIISFLLLLFCSVKSFSQDWWTEQLNINILLTVEEEDTTANVIKLNDLKKGNLIVTYNPEAPKEGWGRQLMVYGVADNELYSKEALKIVIRVATLKKWKKTNAALKIYTLPISKDPRIKLKVRRVHLCTIKFE